jgi:hypothetical protein
MMDIVSASQSGTKRGFLVGMLQVPLIRFNILYLLINLA